MSKFSIHPYSKEYHNRWVSLIDRSNGGTIFHRIDFLNYHGNKFTHKENHILILKGNSLFGILPLAITYDNMHSIAESPYGASYGGPVFINPLNYRESKEITSKLIDYLSSKNISACKFILPIQPCYKHYSDTFKLALLEHNFICTNRDISNVTNLNRNIDVNEIVTSRARNMKPRNLESPSNIRLIFQNFG